MKGPARQALTSELLLTLSEALATDDASRRWEGHRKEVEEGNETSVQSMHSGFGFGVCSKYNCMSPTALQSKPKAFRGPETKLEKWDQLVDGDARNQALERLGAEMPSSECPGVDVHKQFRQY